MSGWFSNKHGDVLRAVVDDLSRGQEEPFRNSVRALWFLVLASHCDSFVALSEQGLPSARGPREREASLSVGHPCLSAVDRLYLSVGLGERTEALRFPARRRCNRWRRRRGESGRRRSVVRNRKRRSFNSRSASTSATSATAASVGSAPSPSCQVLQAVQGLRPSPRPPLPILWGLHWPR